MQLTFRKADRTLMRSTRCAWLSSGALLVALGRARSDAEPPPACPGDRPGGRHHHSRHPDDQRRRAGDYTSDDVNLGPGVIIDTTNWLVADDPQGYHVIVNPDGSGSFTFSNLHSGSLSTGTVSATTISGSDVWTCTPQP
jgi:hypothetical protein